MGRFGRYVSSGSIGGGLCLVLLIGFGRTKAQQLIIEGSPLPLPVGVNSPLDESSVVCSKDGRYLYFTRTHHPDNQAGLADHGDVWYSVRNPQGNWGAVHNIAYPLNTEAGSFLIGLAREDDKMYLFQEDATMQVAPRQIYTALRGPHGDWSAAKPIRIPYYNDRSPQPSGWVSPSDHVLVLSLDAYGTYGVEDLYMTRYDASTNSWQPLRNLGKDINTERQEVYPFMTADLRLLVFSSNRPGGKGSWDFYYALREDDSWRRWSTPKPIEALNTEAAELAFFMPEGEKKAFFARTENSAQYSNLFQVGLRLAYPSLAQEISPETETSVSSPAWLLPTFDLVDKKTETTIQGQVRLKSNQSQWDTTLNITNRATQIPIAVPFNVNAVTLTASASGYLTYVQTIQLRDIENPYQLALNPIEIGKHLKLHNVFFTRGTANFTPESQEGLEGVLLMLRHNPSLALFLEGHTDNQGRFEDNLALSRARVSAIIAYLIAEGIDGKRLHGRGYGSTKPIASNFNEADRQKNRRVEFILQQMLPDSDK